MVFDAIYDTFVKIVDSKMKDKNVDDKIFGDMVLKEMAKALTVAIYRNGTIEDVHAGEGFGARTFDARSYPYVSKHSAKVERIIIHGIFKRKECIDDI